MQAVCDTLEKLVEDGVIKNYAIMGATAAGFHGEPLATRDIDVFVIVEPEPNSLFISLENIFQHLAQLGFKEFEEEALLIHDFPVQFLSVSPGLETEALESAIFVQWDEHKMRVARPEHLAAIAIRTARPKDRARLVYLISLPQFNSADFYQILNRHGLMNSWLQWAVALDLSH
jgi:hypothetical protein